MIPDDMREGMTDRPRLIRPLRRLLAGAGGRQAAEGKLLSAATGAPVKTVLLTSARPGEGKSVASFGFASALARSGLRVLWIDAHPERPAYPRYVEAPVGGPGPGLAAWLSGELSTDRIPPEADHSSLLLCGQTTALSEADFRAADWDPILSKAQAEVDYIVLDAGDLETGSWPATCAPRVDGVLVVASCGHTQSADLEETVQSLRQLDARVLGVILNRKKRILPRWIDANE